MPTITLTPAPLAPRRTLGCVELFDVCRIPLVEEPLPSGAPTAQRRRQAALIRQAETACQACPLLADCLYAAVVEHDVAGVAGGTTPGQRLQIRARLGISVRPEDLDTLAGVVGRNRQVDHDEVLRLRRANPQESLEQLAQRLGCSLSTVKRHLRRERHEPSLPQPVKPKPTRRAVLAAAQAVTGAAAGMRAA